ncbi:MAG: L-aspartate oxidase [Microbacteriaceae bacterium]|nr:L-aspartate oxidase [Microbacteriaceae bacterium]
MSSVIVVGTGIAGLVAALEAGHKGHSVTLVTKSELAESNTRYAQGGIAAVMFPDDTIESHIEDTLRVGAGLNTRRAVEVLCTEGPERVRDLIRLGVAFDREHGQLARGREAAHSSARVLHAGGDATGAAIEAALVAAVRETAARILEYSFVKDLVVRDGRVVGVDVLDPAGQPERLEADAVILASGGAGQLYLHTTNPAVTTGDGVAAALRAGAVLGDVEFYQFHPTSLAAPGNFLISEAVRGEGAVLLDTAGRRFMFDWHPDGELAPRDVVARGIASQMAAQGGAPVLLDATALGAEFLAERFPGITATCLANGLDWGRDPIPVTPAAHYWMGGVRTDEWGRTSIPGLFAVGEVACTGVHGANRLASNSLLESLVFAWRSVSRLDLPWQALRVEPVAGTAAAPTHESAVTVPFERRELQALMWQKAGLFRDGDELRDAAETLSGWDARAASAEPERVVAAHENANLLDLSRLVVDAALVREESRGAHYRSDFPTMLPRFAHHIEWARKVTVNADA